MHIQLSVYDNKIVLWNPGTLPTELPVEKLIDNHPSFTRNKNMADTFYKAGYIESWGRGIQKIIHGFTEAKMPIPEFEDSFGGFQLTMLKGAEKSVEKSEEKSVEKILALISMNPFITQSELAQSTGLTRRGVEKNIQQLKKSGKILRIDPDKGGHWQIVNRNE